MSIPYTKPSFEEWYELLSDDEYIYFGDKYGGDYTRAYNEEMSYYAECAYDAWKDDQLTESA